MVLKHLGKVEGKPELIKEKCEEELEIIREEIKCFNKSRNNKNSGDADAEQSGCKRILNLGVHEADSTIGNEYLVIPVRVDGQGLPGEHNSTLGLVALSQMYLEVKS